MLYIFVWNPSFPMMWTKQSIGDKEVVVSKRYSSLDLTPLPRIPKDSNDYHHSFGWGIPANLHFPLINAGRNTPISFSRFDLIRQFFLGGEPQAPGISHKTEWEEVSHHRNEDNYLHLLCRFSCPAQHFAKWPFRKQNSSQEKKSWHEFLLPSRKLTYHPKMAFWRWFSFSQGGIC